MAGPRGGGGFRRTTLFARCLERELARAALREAAAREQTPIAPAEHLGASWTGDGWTCAAHPATPTTGGTDGPANPDSRALA